MPINRPALVVTRDRTKFISLVGVVLSRAPLAIASLVQLSVVSNTIYARDNMAADGMKEALDKAGVYGQEHIFRWREELTSEQEQKLLSDFNDLELDKITKYFADAQHKMKQTSEMEDSRLAALPSNICGSTIEDTDRVPAWAMKGLERISRGEVAVLLMAGGQGTRLGVTHPKGMYNVGLPSDKTLFQLQAERILKLQQLAKQQFGRDCTIPWYIMTSEYTKDMTVSFFQSHSHFGLSPSNIVTFEQDTLPCLDFTGKILMDQKYHISRAPDGNGGLYLALRKNNILKDMETRGVQCVHVYGVDNILVKMADPVFIGFCTEKGAECGAKVVRKAFPSEKVGIVTVLDGKYQVVEYSEISSNIANQRNQDGSLTFSAGNICNHYFTVAYLHDVCNTHYDHLPHHVAEKKIPYINEEGERIQPTDPNGIKMEKFVFDVFQFCTKFAVLEVRREDEFSPLKNAPGSAKDCPESCRRALMDLHYRQLVGAGGRVNGISPHPQQLVNGESNGDNEVVCEISPLVSYGGEGLDKICNNKIFDQPVVL